MLCMQLSKSLWCSELSVHHPPTKSVPATQENVPLQKCHVLLLSSLKKLGHLATGLCLQTLRDAGTAILLCLRATGRVAFAAEIGA